MNKVRITQLNEVPFKISGAIMTVTSFVVGIVPQFTACAYFGKAIALQDGRTVDMKCLWTARAELAVAAGMFAVGALMFTSKSLDTRRHLSIIGLIMGAFTILFPTELIGVCASPMMLCRSVMTPTLLITGGLAVVVSGTGLALSFSKARLNEHSEISTQER